MVVDTWIQRESDCVDKVGWTSACRAVIIILYSALGWAGVVITVHSLLEALILECLFVCKVNTGSVGVCSQLPYFLQIPWFFY